MAHLNKSSLMSRLFPQEDRPAKHFSSVEDSSSSTLFSAERAPFGSSSSFRDENLRPNDLFQACFASFSNDATKDKVQPDKAIEGDMLTSLREAFVQEGVELHNSVRNKLIEAQQDVNCKISEFTAFSSSIASDIDELYANLSYPLTATLCRSESFPSTTIEAHLASVRGQLREAESKVRSLQVEWEENFRLEEKFRLELVSMEKHSGQNVDHSKMASLKEEVEQLVADNTQALNEIEETYKEEVHVQTMKMMKDMWD
ncbi:hypothetical protein ACHAQJ_004878 [Trichoderma viride]